MVSRRDVILSALVAFPTYALLQEARAAGTVTDGRLPAKRWIDRQEELAFALRSGSLSALNWHDEVNRIAGEVDVDELMVETSRGLVTTAGAPFMRDPVKRRIRFLNEDGQARHLSYAAATFTFGPENVITPHGHKHMASAHMVVGGKVRIRTFDRISDEENALVIRPTGDHIGEVGSAAAMTTAKDNIHWFSPITSRSVTFDVIVDGLDVRVIPTPPCESGHAAEIIPCRFSGMGVSCWSVTSPVTAAVGI